MALIASAPVLIYYSTEFKQYAGDILFTLLVLYVGLSYDRWRFGRAILTAVGVAGILLSHPSVFVLAAVVSVIGIEKIIAKEWQELIKLIGVAIVLALSFGITYSMSAGSLAANSYLTEFWTEGFAPVLVNTRVELGWYWNSALSAVFLAFQQFENASLRVDPAWYSPANVLLLSMCLFGTVCLFFRSKRLFGFMAVTIIIAIAASALHLYPLRGRLILFLVPFIFLAASSLVDWMADLKTPWGPSMTAVAAVGLIALPFMTSFEMGVSKMSWRHGVSRVN